MAKAPLQHPRPGQQLPLLLATGTPVPRHPWGALAPPAPALPALEQIRPIQSFQ